MDLYGGAAMPFFYLLSGFVMAIAYGSELLAMPGDTSGNDGKVFDRNRFCKIVMLSRFVALCISLLLR